MLAAILLEVVTMNNRHNAQIRDVPQGTIEPGSTVHPNSTDRTVMSPLLYEMPLCQLKESVKDGYSTPGFLRVHL